MPDDADFTYRGGLVLTSVLGALMIWGIVLESPKIAGEMQRTLVNTTPKYAYQVTLDKYNKLHWHDPATQKTRKASRIPRRS